MAKLTAASVQYDDYKGTVALDGPDRGEALYELAGISRDDWFIAGIEVGGFYGNTYAYIWALPAGDGGYDAWEAQANTGDFTLRAKRFPVDVESENIALRLLTVNKRWHIQATWKAITHLEMTLEDPEAAS